jgi:hypothetical protein
MISIGILMLGAWYLVSFHIFSRFSDDSSEILVYFSIYTLKIILEQNVNARLAHSHGFYLEFKTTISPLHERHTKRIIR